MNLKSVVGAVGIVLASQASAQVTFYQGEDFHGRAFVATRSVDNFDRTGFNDRSSSMVVERGRWEVCEDANFEGRCVVVRPGSYPSLSTLGMDNRISSVRPVTRQARFESEVPPPLAAPNYEYRWRPNIGSAPSSNPGCGRNGPGAR